MECEHKWIEKELFYPDGGECIQIRYCQECKGFERRYHGEPEWGEPCYSSFPTDRLLDILLNRPPEYNILEALTKKNV